MLISVIGVLIISPSGNIFLTYTRRGIKWTEKEVFANCYLIFKRTTMEFWVYRKNYHSCSNACNANICASIDSSLQSVQWRTLHSESSFQIWRASRVIMVEGMFLALTLYVLRKVNDRGSFTLNYRVSPFVSVTIIACLILETASIFLFQILYITL